MRPSLNNIELIDNYLNGSLSEKEKNDFENALKSNSELQEQVQIQKELIQTAKRIGIKKEIKKVAKGNSGFNLGNIVIIGGIVIAIIAAIYFLSDPKEDEKIISQKKETSAEVKNEGAEETKNEIAESAIVPQTKQPVVAKNKSENFVVNNAVSEKTNDCYDFNGLKTWVKPDVQSFSVLPSKGATIEGKEGTLIIVPSNAFVDENNQVITSEVTVELVEALNLEDMVLYNLGTTSNGTPLESGGMLNIRAMINDKEVKINPVRPLYIEVPTNEVKAGMMAFEGKIQSDGKLNWENPKALKKYLVNVPLKNLDFLPEGFAQKVKTFVPFKNFKEASKPLVDSLYYSLDRNEKNTTDEQIGGKNISKEKSLKPIMQGRDVIGYSRDTVTENNLYCGINPSSIKTIKTKEFSKTCIATKEFEDRVGALHKLENGDAMLKIYVDHLAEDLCVSDSIVATKLKESDKKTFENFAAQKCTNIKDAAIYQEQLSAYYSKKRKEYQTAKEGIFNAWKYMQTKELNDIVEAIQKENALATKLANNLPKVSSATNNAYAFNWSKGGWVNIDEYLHILSKGFISLKMKINNAVGTTEVYQWLNTINNLTPLNIEKGYATALFPLEKSAEGPKMKNTFCLAIDKKGDAYQWFELRYNPYTSQQIEVNLAPKNIEEIQIRLRSFHVNHDLEKRLNDVEKMAQESAINSGIVRPSLVIASKKGPSAAEKRQEEIMRENQMIEELKKVAFKCYATQADSFNIESSFGK
jgi:hypothetical protein